MELIVWLVLALLASLGNGARTVAASVRDLQPTLLPQQIERLRRYKLGGMALSFIALAGSAAVAVAFMWSRTGDMTLTALGAAVSTLLVLLAEEVARGMAHANMERFAEPFLGDAAALLPLIEPHPESTEPEEVREETVDQVVDATEKAGLIEPDEREMISGVIGLNRTVTREIMAPRIDVIALDVESSLYAALEVIINAGHSRLPVYEESIDHVVGLLYAKDLLTLLRDGKMDTPLRSVLRSPHFVPESKPVDELLEELQTSKVHMAVVVDEYGGTAGVVTIEDVLEEIVGDIQDEYDIGEEPLVGPVSENEGVFDARVTVGDVNDELSVHLPDESSTLGGLVYQRLQKMPKVGDQVHLEEVTLAVLSVVGRRIKKVRVSKDVKTEPPPGPGAAAPESAASVDDANQAVA